MDCVGCDKCRLWGKLNVHGMGTALRILFADLPHEKIQNGSWRRFELSRNDVVALFNSIGRFASSIKEVGMFRKLINEMKWNSKKFRLERWKILPKILHKRAKKIENLEKIGNFVGGLGQVGPMTPSPPFSIQHSPGLARSINTRHIAIKINLVGFSINGHLCSFVSCWYPGQICRTFAFSLELIFGLDNWLLLAIDQIQA